MSTSAPPAVQVESRGQLLVCILRLLTRHIWECSLQRIHEVRHLRLLGSTKFVELTDDNHT